MNTPLLKAGNVIQLGGKICEVIRVTDCAAVIAVPQELRTFTPRFGKPVTIIPKPKLVRISPNSELPILNR
jgi:hypothetical protein